MVSFGGRFKAVTAAVVLAGLMTALPARAEDWVQPKDSPDATVSLAPMPQGWSLSGSNAAEYTAGICAAERWAGQASGVLMSTGFNVVGGAHLTRTVDASAYRGQRVRLTARIKTDRVQTGAGFWLTATGTAPVDQPMTVAGTTDWQPISVNLDVPMTAQQVSFGLTLQGRGRVFLSGVQIEVVPQDTVAQRTPDISFGG